MSYESTVVLSPSHVWSSSLLPVPWAISLDDQAPSSLLEWHWEREWEQEQKEEGDVVQMTLKSNWEEALRTQHPATHPSQTP